jgi:hypothetical protein
LKSAVNCWVDYTPNERIEHRKSGKYGKWRTYAIFPYFPLLHGFRTWSRFFLFHIFFFCSYKACVNYFEIYFWNIITNKINYKEFLFAYNFCSWNPVQIFFLISVLTQFFSFLVHYSLTLKVASAILMILILFPISLLYNNLWQSWT